MLSIDSRNIHRRLTTQSTFSRAHPNPNQSFDEGLQRPVNFQYIRLPTPATVLSCQTIARGAHL